ncbi:asbB gene product [Streptococcus dysgalactiae subsp. equisimilis 167]|nr:asbB gene product [Streptococcus dysgalactiae subsp. equisimilis 167]
MIKKSWLSHIVSRKRLLYNDSVRLRFQNLRGLSYETNKEYIVTKIG